MVFLLRIIFHTGCYMDYSPDLNYFLPMFASTLFLKKSLSSVNFFAYLTSSNNSPDSTVWPQITVK